MNLKKMVRVSYKGECFMTYDFSRFAKYIDSESLYSAMSEMMSWIEDAVFEMENHEEMKRYKDELWKDHEDIREIGEKAALETKAQCDDTLNLREIHNGLMKNTLNEEQYNIWLELYNKEIEYENRMCEKSADIILEYKRGDGQKSELPII